MCGFSTRDVKKGVDPRRLGKVEFVSDWSNPLNDLKGSLVILESFWFLISVAKSCYRVVT